MTLEELKNQMVEIPKSHAKFKLKYTMFNMLLEEPEDKSEYPSETLRLHTNFGNLLENIPEQKYEAIVDKLNDPELYNHNGSFRFLPFITFLFSLSTMPPENQDAFSNENIVVGMKAYRHFRESLEKGADSKTPKTPEDELEINKELSPQEIEIANKLRSAGTKVLGQMINNMMETPLDPAVEKAIKKAEEEELPVTNIKDEEAKEEAEPASKEKKKDTGKTIGWVVLGGLALIGAIAFVKRPRQQNQITNQAVENTENAVNKTTSSQDVSQPAEPPTPAPKPKLRPEEILAQYNDVDSFSGALMDMLNDKEVPAPKSESKDKYANIPTAKDVFGPASY